MSHSLVKCGFYRSLSRAVCAGTCAACVRILVPRGRPRECVVDELFIAHNPLYRWGCVGCRGGVTLRCGAVAVWPTMRLSLRMCCTAGRTTGVAATCWEGGWGSMAARACVGVCVVCQRWSVVLGVLWK